MPRTRISSAAARVAGSVVALAMLVPATAAGVAAATPQAPAAVQADGPAIHFVVLGPVGGGLKQTEDTIKANGGTIVQSWPQIGVVVTTSQDAKFAEIVRGKPGVEQAGASRDFAELLPPQPQAQVHQDRKIERLEGKATPKSKTPGQEPLESEQWDLPLIKADKAHEISQGDKKTVVGVLDFGIDPDHADLKPNLAVGKSVSCASEGVPNRDIAAWRPKDETQMHGSHVAGSIAAARNGIGIAGVAPNVTLASVRVIDDNGFIFPEYAVCGFVWAAEQGFDVTNSSYFVDPWYLWCDTDIDQKAGAEAVRRAIRYAQGKDVVNIAAAGNSNWDLSKPIHDTVSPNHGGPTEDRMTGPECQKLPGEVEGVVTVSSTGVRSEKSYFSNYGLGNIAVTAPGGDKNQIPNTPSANGRILSTVPGGGWGWAQGTSMASPHAAGVAALIRSAHPDWTAEQVKGALANQADPIACPPVYDPDGDGNPDAVCEGANTGAGFYGAGMIDALEAVQG